MVSCTLLALSACVHLCNKVSLSACDRRKSALSIPLANQSFMSQERRRKKNRSRICSTHLHIASIRLVKRKTVQSTFELPPTDLGAPLGNMCEMPENGSSSLHAHSLLLPCPVTPSCIYNSNICDEQQLIPQHYAFVSLGVGADGGGDEQ